jgi:hypothetical protein
MAEWNAFSKQIEATVAGTAFGGIEAPKILAVAFSDGTIKLYDISVYRRGDAVRLIEFHTRRCFWNKLTTAYVFQFAGSQPSACRAICDEHACRRDPWQRQEAGPGRSISYVDRRWEREKPSWLITQLHGSG